MFPNGAKNNVQLDQLDLKRGKSVRANHFPHKARPKNNENILKKRQERVQLF